MVVCGGQAGNVVKLVSFLRENSESSSGAKIIPMGFAKHYQAAPEREELMRTLTMQGIYLYPYT